MDSASCLLDPGRIGPYDQIYLAIGIMVPIRLGTVGLPRLMVDLHLVNTLWSLILVYTAQGVPLAIFVLSVESLLEP